MELCLYLELLMTVSVKYKFCVWVRSCVCGRSSYIYNTNFVVEFNLYNMVPLGIFDGRYQQMSLFDPERAACLVSVVPVFTRLSRVRTLHIIITSLTTNIITTISLHHQHIDVYTQNSSPMI